MVAISNRMINLNGVAAQELIYGISANQTSNRKRGYFYWVFIICLFTAFFIWDNADRITGLTETGQTARSFGYDELDRLTSFKIGTANTTAYTYDANGNRTKLTTPTATTNYAIAAASNRLTGLTGGATQTLGYDTAGNLTTDGTRTYTYDARGRMISAKVGSVTTNYAVNALGQRIGKYGGSVTSSAPNNFVYDEAGHMLGEYSATGAIITEFVWLGDTPTAALKGTGGATVYSIAADWLNAPHIVQNASKQNVWIWDHQDFGNTAPNQNPAGLGAFTFNFRYPGQYTDTETGLSQNWMRDYNPAFGRYVQSDPIGLAGGVNTFGYVGGNAVTRTDPSGEFAWAAAIPILAVGLLDPDIKHMFWAAGGELAAIKFLTGATKLFSTASINSSSIKQCESVDELLSNSTLTSSTNRLQNYTRNNAGGFSQANTDFDSIIGNANFQNYPGNIRGATLPDGTTISVRPSSSNGAPTIQINRPDQPPIKVRYE
ncbi:MAG: RHS repeat-associated core domain-containing protein [Bdellovibrionales bacterium]